MVYEYFNLSDTDESVLELHEIWKVELQDDKVHPFNTRWDETIITMKKQADEEILDDSFHQQLQQLEQLHLLSLYIQDTVQKG